LTLTMLLNAIRGMFQLFKKSYINNNIYCYSGKIVKFFQSNKVKFLSYIKVMTI